MALALLKQRKRGGERVARYGGALQLPLAGSEVQLAGGCGSPHLLLLLLLLPTLTL